MTADIRPGHRVTPVIDATAGTNPDRYLATVQTLRNGNAWLVDRCWYDRSATCHWLPDMEAAIDSLHRVGGFAR